MDINHQPYDGALGDALIERLESGDYQQLEFMVAFAKQSGVLRLKPYLEAFRAAGRSISAFVGIDMDGTSYDALCSLLPLCDELYVVHTESASQTFHSKVYAFTGPGSVWATVASNNLTYSGLWRNFESSATEVLNLSDPTDAARVERLKSRFEKLRDVTSSVSMRLFDLADIDQLLAQGYVRTEFSLNVRTRQREKQEASGGPSLFATQVSHPTGPAAPGRPPSGAPAAVPASIVPSPPTVQGIAAWVGEVFWTESRAMTSPARNQLDLSMLGRVVSGDAATAGYADRPGWAVGSLSFFGMDPTAQRTERNVTLSFQGTDYRENRVYFPDSQGANGTWRIQLNGIDSAGLRLDHRVGTGGFVQKILAFQRIADDYYALTILDTSQLESIRLASGFVAKNGSGANGKLYGVFKAVE